MQKMDIIAVGFQILDRKKFFKTIEEIRKLESSQELKQIDGNCLTAEFQDVFPTDIVNMLFLHIQSGTYYFLSCDSYHGGGEWEKICSKEPLRVARASIKALGSIF